MSPPGNMNGDDVTSVVDVQCGLITVVWELGGMVGAAPDCLAGGPEYADSNCDGTVTVVDVQVVVNALLGAPLDASVDSDKDGCVDVCLLSECCSPSCGTETINPCGGAGDFTCCKVDNGAPGCKESACETCVCVMDPFCCDTSWDEICVGEARNECDADCNCPSISNCCILPGEAPGCGPNNFACEECVCAEDPSCCDKAWDVLCVGIAIGYDCESTCGCAETDTCITFITDQKCCSIICAVDPFCCEVQFDEICQDELILCENSQDR